jgi:exodeoxyribonuclease VII large subunit
MENSGQATAITVSELNRQVRTLLERGVGRLWVEGEISNLARPASGHLYFRIKDESAQISAAFFRNRQRGPTHALKNGDHVLAYGQVSLYEARGDYQLIVEQIEAAGEGVLQRRYEALKKKLAAEGLFEEDRKQPIPVLVLRRRFPFVPVVIYPAAVQGDAAPGELIGALQAAVRRNECDVLILTRGGGSLEDLWAFNDEQLARAIAGCPLPVVSAVGHEVDFTIADFVADVRAPTPSGAAELVVPDRGDWLRAIETVATRIARQGRRTLENTSQALDWLGRRLATASPAARVARQQDLLRENAARLAAAMRRELHARSSRLFTLNRTLLQASPAIRVQRAISCAAQLRQRLATAGRGRVADAGHRLRLTARALDAVSPLATLDRGYAIVTDAATGKALTRASQVKSGDDVRARLAHGELLATITGIVDDKD